MMSHVTLNKPLCALDEAISIIIVVHPTLVKMNSVNLQTLMLNDEHVQGQNIPTSYPIK